MEKWALEKAKRRGRGPRNGSEPERLARLVIERRASWKEMDESTFMAIRDIMGDRAQRVEIP